MPRRIHIGVELSYAAILFDLYGTLIDDDGSPVDGAFAALSLLPADRWAIVTSCGERFALTLLRSAGLPVPRTLVGAEHVARGKPAPEPYVLGARLLGRSPSEILVVEDSHAGVAAGRGAGMDVVAIARGRGNRFARNATFSVDRFAEIGWQVEATGSISVRFAL